MLMPTATSTSSSRHRKRIPWELRGGTGRPPGSSIPISDFFIAKPTDNLGAINSALAQGKNLILTPGIYSLDGPIHVLRRDTVVLGLGFPTLVPKQGNIAMSVGDV